MIKDIDTETTLVDNVGYILVYQDEFRENKIRIYSNHVMFQSEYIKITFLNEYLILSIPDIDFKGKIYKTIRHNKCDKWRSFTTISEKIKKGKFYIDEEDSTEDELIIYYNQDDN